MFSDTGLKQSTAGDYPSIRCNLTLSHMHVHSEFDCLDSSLFSQA